MNKFIYLTGLNHRTAAVEIRERYALTSVERFENGLLEACPVREIMALSTCNRVELLCISEHGPESGVDVLGAMHAYWAGRCNGKVAEIAEHTYSFEGLAAVEHLFTVASSLDSLVMGEPQILGQLKDAYRHAVDCGTARVIINRLLHKSFSVAKRVRTETAVASSAVSISFAAVELARKIFGSFQGKTAMLVGAGEMAELAATHLLNNGVEKLIIANRTLARAQALAANLGGEPIPIENLLDRLAEVDIVISSTGSPTAVIRARDVQSVLKRRKHRSMFFIDIAVPRDIDPDVNGLDNVYLYDIDDLKEVVEENMAQRRDEAVKARALVSEETRAFAHWLTTLDLQPTIVDLLGRAEEVARRELAKTLRRIGDVDEPTRAALETLVLSVSRKVLHEPVCFLKRRTREEGAADHVIVTARRFFNLDNDCIPPDAHADRRTVDDCDCELEPDDPELDAGPIMNEDC
ncbi:MAG: glutamyl-tRNA reductase [Desulfovibrio sp.]